MPKDTLLNTTLGDLFEVAAREQPTWVFLVWQEGDKAFANWGNPKNMQHQRYPTDADTPLAAARAAIIRGRSQDRPGLIVRAN